MSIFETNYGLDPNAIDLLKANNEASSGSSVGYYRNDGLDSGKWSGLK